MNCKKLKIGFCFLIAMLLLSCGSKSKLAYKPLYEVLTQQKDGGATIRFFEILNEAKEIKMLLNDSNLRKKISHSKLQFYYSKCRRKEILRVQCNYKKH